MVETAADDRLTVRRLWISKASVDLRFWREGAVTRHEVLAIQGDVHAEAR
ncbi:MAG: hypothetical protein KIT40_01455 [Nitrospira sp.]|nr:hypothetical protein [Nitrospira sp.]